jgi:hypothetical protein
MAQYKLVGPSVKETPMAWNRLHMRYGIHRGITIMRINGIYSTYRYPSQTEILQAEEVYMGGHEYIIDEHTKNELTAQGYGEFITAL